MKRAQLLFIEQLIVFVFANVVFLFAATVRCPAVQAAASFRAAHQQQQEEMTASNLVVRQTSKGSFTRRLYKDIYLREQSDRLAFGNSKLTLEVSKTPSRSKEHWLSLHLKGLPGNIIAPSKTQTPVDFLITAVFS